MLSSRAINYNKNRVKFPVKPVYYGLLLVGIVLRLIPYLLDRSLFIDEASIALNVTNRSFAGLLHTLDYGQIAPLLFLFIEKATIILFGNSEQSLRLLPLICGLLSLPLIYRLTKYLTGNNIAALIALLLFATSPALIDYSNQVKQYEGDVFCALCLLTLVFSPSFSQHETKRYILLAIVGSVLVFMSNVIVLVMFTVGVYYLLKYGRAIFSKRLLLAAFACWEISFLVYYVFFIYHNPLRVYMVLVWQPYFMPVQIFSASFWVWMYKATLSVFKFYSLPFLIFFLFSVVIFVVKKQRLYLFLLLFPLTVHFILSAFKIYPFETRLILYLIVFITPAIAIGIVEMANLLKRIAIYPVVTLFMLVVYSVIAQLVNTNYPFYKEEIKGSIDFINADRSAGQKVYVYYGANRALNYYLKVKPVSFYNDMVWGTDDWKGENKDNCFNDLNKLNGEVWLLFSHVYPGDDDYTVKRLVQAHDSVLKSYKTIGSSAYLVKINSTIK
jgi:4-amino-4-deoxy-L-arabinose transferase-like glycosyltransferase